MSERVVERPHHRAPSSAQGRNRAGRRPVAPVEWVALAVALTPFAVAVVRAGLRHWMPVGDAAYFTVRSRDVLTAHHPLLGAWSSGSSVVGVPVNNLGPLQLDLLAPFTRVAPYLGTRHRCGARQRRRGDGRVGRRPPTPRAVAGGGGDGGNPGRSWRRSGCRG